MFTLVDVVEGKSLGQFDHWEQAFDYGVTTGCLYDLAIAVTATRKLVGYIEEGKAAIAYRMGV